MTGPARGALFARVLAWLEHQQWELDVDDESDANTGRAMLSPSDGAPPWPVIVVVHEPDAQVIFYSLLPDEVPAERRAEVAELMTGINDGLTVGNVEIDMDDGDARARTSIEFGEAEPDDGTLARLLGRLLGACLDLGATYFGAIADVVAATSTPAQARAAAEEG